MCSPALELGPFQFITNFDSANLLTAELVSNPLVQQESLSFHPPDYEINLWTKPDCYGTPFQNGNRTWFHFGIRGGRPSAVVKFNILNLNKQIKLFQQGMQPVYRYLPEKYQWERIRDKMIINEKENLNSSVCSISFRHRLSERPQSSVLYIAFTYSFSYHDLTEWLSSVDSKYIETLRSGNVPFDHSPFPTRAESILSRASWSKDNAIYYHRECACLTLDGRRVDLITISSVQGMAQEREERLINLFPKLNEERPFKFPGKKVVFFSARVHPGETPSQFVLNGLLKFLLEPKDPQAVVLRRMFVFKCIPMLNPDGVARGHYRTDPRGVNLNRVYLQPSPVLHPSIYAAKKLILYYHHGRDTPDDYEYENEFFPKKDSTSVTSVLKGNDSCLKNESEPQRLDTSNACKTNLSTGLVETVLVANSERKNVIKNSLCAGCVTETLLDSSNVEVENQITASNECQQIMVELELDSNSNIGNTVENTDVHIDANINMSIKLDSFDSTNEVEYHQCTFESCDEDSVADVSDVKSENSNSRLSLENIPTSCSCSARRSSPYRIGSSQSERDFLVKNSDASTCKKKKSCSKTRLKNMPGSSSTHYSSLIQNVSISDSKSGLFMYIDMHGHATKRGIFMYGNHFSDPTVQAECMLLPRLMAMNCQHFDFSACNFTERLMNMKDRRDGASREGSGRVAVLRHTGLIRSYTLECNYNTGRLVNHVSSRPSYFGLNDPLLLPSPHPPKFTPELFEAAGKALGESILDLTGVNPWSRINSTEYRSLEGMRRWLVRRLQNSPEYSMKLKEINLRKTASLSGVLTSSGSGSLDIPLLPSSKTRQSKGSTAFARKGTSAKVPERPAFGPLVPKKENQNSNPTIKPKPSTSKLKSALPAPAQRPAASTSKSKMTKILPTSKEETAHSTVQSKSSINKIFKAKRGTSRKVCVKARTEKGDTSKPLPK